MRSKTCSRSATCAIRLWSEARRISPGSCGTAAGRYGEDVPGSLSFQKLYPVEGDTAIAELLAGDEIWGDLRLEDIKLDQRGEDRLHGVRVVISIYGTGEGRELEEFDFDECVALLRQAREWLLENERGREPL